MAGKLGNMEYGVARFKQCTGIQRDESLAPVSCVDRYHVLFKEPVKYPTFLDVSGLPAGGSPHTVFDGLFARNFSFDPEGADGFTVSWIVEVGYGQKTKGDNEDVGRYTALEGGGETQDVPLIYDAETGEAVLNAAGEPFDNVPNVPRANTTILISRTEKTLPTDAREKLNNTVNASAITVYNHHIPARCGRIEINWKETLDKSPYPIEWTYKITIKRNPVKNVGGDAALVDIGHDEAFLEEGFHFKKDGKLVRFREMETGDEDEDEVMPVTPTACLLTYTGEDGRAGQNGNAAAQAFFKRVNAYKSANWGTLKLPAGRPSTL